MRKKLTPIKKGAILGGIFGIILVILLFSFVNSYILNIFTFIPSFIALILFAMQHFILKGNLFGNPENSILYFVSFIIIIFYILIGMLIAYLIKRRN